MNGLLLMLALSTPSQAGESLNAHGFHMAPGSGQPLDLLTVHAGNAPAPRSVHASGVFELARSPLVLYSKLDDEISRGPLLDRLATLNLGASVGLHERISVGATTPMHLASWGPDGFQGSNPGDVRVFTPVSLLLPQDAGGAGVRLAPFVDLPTGSTERYLGNVGASGGGLLAAEYGTRRWRVVGNLGGQLTPRIDFENLEGGFLVLASAGGGYALTEHLAVRLEAAHRIHTRTKPEPHAAGTESPGELLLSMRHRPPAGLGWTAGASTATTPGAGAATWRAFLGISWSVEPEPPPPARADLVLSFVDPDGQPVPQAQVQLGDQSYQTDASGQLRFEDQAPGSRLAAGSTDHPYFLPKQLSEISLKEGFQERTFVLTYQPGRVRVVARDHDGEPIQGRVAFDGPEPQEPTQMRSDGTLLSELPPGTWQVAVSADDFGTERRTVTLEPGEQSLVVIEVSLRPAQAVQKDREVVTLAPVRFDFDKDTLQDDAFPILDHVAAVLLDNPHIRLLEVQGHTDNVGGESYNLDLSQRRVETVRGYLISQGVSGDRLEARGYGLSKPIASNETDAGRAKNRRVQFIILEADDDIDVETTE